MSLLCFGVFVIAMLCERWMLAWIAFMLMVGCA